MNKKTLKNDLILIVCLLLSAAFVWGLIKLTQKKGVSVVVERNGSETARYPLETDLTVDIPSEDGGVNTLVISDGYAYIVSADCPDKLCVKQHAISRTGQTIICLPHRLVIRIEGGEGVDTVS